MILLVNYDHVICPDTRYCSAHLNNCRWHEFLLRYRLTYRRYCSAVSASALRRQWSELRLIHRKSKQTVSAMQIKFTLSTLPFNPAAFARQHARPFTPPPGGKAFQIVYIGLPVELHAKCCRTLHFAGFSPGFFTAAITEIRRQLADKRQGLNIRLNETRLRASRPPLGGLLYLH